MMRRDQGIKASRHQGIGGSVFAVAMMLSAGFLFGCGEEDPMEPPRLFYGQDVCAVCHMIISDERYAAAISIRDERGRIHKHGFDDMGCIFEYEEQNPDQPILAYFVRDVRSHGWIDATRAEFVHSRDIHTPMAFGLAAFPTLPEARELRDEVGGDLINLAEARRRFNLNVLHVSTLGEEPEAIERDMSGTRILDLDDGRRLRLRLETPQTLAPGEHPFQIIVEQSSQADGADWLPLNELQIEIEPWMPSMHHGSPNNVQPRPLGEGRYEGQIHFTMAGHWVVHVTVNDATIPASRVTFHFEAKR
jgi:copper chaperone NosL